MDYMPHQCPVVIFVVYKVHKDNDIDIMSDYFRKKNVIVRNITRMSHDAAKFKSFKITVSFGGAEKVADSQF